jgi:Lrp/AsnC family leucine-responsive transcriptional regulator
VLKVYLKEVAALEQLVDQLVVYGDTTTAIVQSSPVKPRNLPVSSVP